MNSDHWNNVYATKDEKEVSWFQENPQESIDFITALNPGFDDAIIDIGGGDSHLTDHLLTLGYKNLAVLDISETALMKLKQRLNSNSVNYIVSDVTEFRPTRKYKVWHDRATFHFLTTKEQIESYLDIAFNAIEEGGYLIVSTFSKTGPLKCSGLPIHQYSENDLKGLFGRYFKNIRCFESTHTTPWGSTQDFVYCGFKKSI